MSLFELDNYKMQFSVALSGGLSGVNRQTAYNQTRTQFLPVSECSVINVLLKEALHTTLLELNSLRSVRLIKRSTFGLGIT